LRCWSWHRIGGYGRTGRDDTTQIINVFSGGNATLRALTLSHGEGDDGAAITNSGGTVTLQNSTISASNTPDFEDGGIFQQRRHG
jgi:hypothetical protein